VTQFAAAKQAANSPKASDTIRGREAGREFAEGQVTIHERP
jgi:hypothetical protein